MGNRETKEAVVFDMSSLQFAQRGPFLMISSAAGNLLHLAEVPEEASAEAQFALALTEMTEKGTVSVGEEETPIALYDPFTRLTQSFCGVFSGTLAVEAEGTLVALESLTGPLEGPQVALLLANPEI